MTADETTIQIKQLLKELSQNFGAEFVENLFELKKDYQQLVLEKVKSNRAQYSNEDEFIEALCRDFSQHTFELMLKIIKPLWEKVQSLEQEVKFLRQK